MIIGISGVAGVGKDTLYSIISSKINCKRFSLGDELKKEVRGWCKEHYLIDPLNCYRYEKETIRDFLVFHASYMRSKTSGRYWIEKISNTIKNDNNKNKIITDIRYDDYENDEVSWLKDELDGVLVHVSQYRMEPRLNVWKKIYKEPANSEESRNEPKLRRRADFKIEWPVIKDSDDLEKKLSHYVDELLFQVGYDKLGLK